MFGQFLLSDVQQIDDASGMAVFEYDPEIVVLKVGPEIFDDVFVIAESQDLDLLLDCGDLG